MDTLGEGGHQAEEGVILGLVAGRTPEVAEGYQWSVWASTLAVAAAKAQIWENFCKALDRLLIESKKIVANHQSAEAGKAALIQHFAQWRWGTVDLKQ